jgi:hypothetical protein
VSRSLVLVALVALGALLAPDAADAQCAMCRATLEGAAEGRALGRAFNSAILVMIAAPYLIFGGFAAFLLRRRIASRLPRLASALQRAAGRQPSAT